MSADLPTDRCSAKVMAGLWVVALLGGYLLVEQSVSTQRAASAERLWAAVKTGDIEGVRTALAGRASATTVDGTGFSPLMWACVTGQADLVREFAARGVIAATSDEGLREAAGCAILSHYSRADDRAECLEVLLAEGLDPDGLLQGQPLLYLAAAAGHDAAVERLLAHAADVNARTLKGNTALMTAAGTNDGLAVVRRLLAAGADIGVTNRAGRTAAMEAAEAGHDEILRVLLDARADANTVDRPVCGCG